MRLKRTILLASAALLAGAVVNVGVAWWRLLHIPDTTLFCFPLIPSYSGDWPIARPERWPMPDSLYVDRTSGAASYDYSSMYVSPVFRISCGMDHTEAGWPMPSFASTWGMLMGVYKTRIPCGPREFWNSGPAGLQFVDRIPETFWMEGIPSPEWFAERGERFKAARLPIRPLWPGFAINTLLYAASASTPFALFAAARRWRRRANFQCPACAYDLRGLPPGAPGSPGAPCPECGAART